MTITTITNWVFSIGALIFLYYIWKEKNTIYIAVRDKNNKIHKVPVYMTDSEDVVRKKVDIYLKKIQ